MSVVFGGDVEADEFDLGVVVARDDWRINRGDDRERADGDAVEMVGGPAGNKFIDLKLVFAGGGELVREERIAGGVKVVVAGDDFAVRIEEAKDKVGFGTDRFGGGIEDQVVARIGGEMERVRIAAGLVSAPEGNWKRREFLWSGVCGFRFDELREVIYVKFEAGGFTGRSHDAEFVRAARESGWGCDFDPELGGLGSRIGEDGGGEIGIAELDCSGVLEVFAGEF